MYYLRTTISIYNPGKNEQPYNTRFDFHFQMYSDRLKSMHVVWWNLWACLKPISVQWLPDCISASLNIDQLMHHSWTKVIFLLLNQPKWPSSSLHTPAHLGTCLTLKQRWVIFQSYGPPQPPALVISIWSPIHFLSRRLINLVWTNMPRSESQVHVMHKNAFRHSDIRTPFLTEITHNTNCSIAAILRSRHRTYLHLSDWL